MTLRLPAGERVRLSDDVPPSDSDLDFPTIAPTLSDGVVTLRAHRPEDLPAIIEQCTDPVMMRWTTVPRPYRHEEAFWFTDFLRQHWEMGARGVSRGWAIELPDAGVPRFAGSIDYRKDLEWPVAEVGYGLHPWARGAGATERALRLVLEFAFERDGVETMHWKAVRGNWGSRRIAWRCGFRFEGTIRDLHTGPAGVDDCWIGSLRRDEPRRPRTPWHEPPTLRGEHVLLRACREDGDGAEEWWLRSRERMADGELVEWAIVDPDPDARHDPETGGGPVVGVIRLEGMTTGASAWGLDPGAARLSTDLHGPRGAQLLDEARALVLRYARTAVADGGLGLSSVRAPAAAEAELLR